MERVTPHAHRRLDEGETIRIRVGENGYVVGFTVDRDADGNLFVVLHGLDCNLEGEQPGVYYPVPRD